MSQNRSKSLGTLGLAMKSGNVVSGEFLTEQAIRAGTARLVIVAEDASDNTKNGKNEDIRNCKKYSGKK